MTVEEAISRLKEVKGLIDIRAFTVYRNACDMAIEALEKQIPKKPIFVEEVYDHHEWRKDGDEIDMWAAESDFHNGPVCERCGESFCIHCYADVIDEKLNEKCDNSHYICPSCGKKVFRSFSYCKCGQQLGWSKE